MLTVLSVAGVFKLFGSAGVLVLGIICMVIWITQMAEAASKPTATPPHSPMPRHHHGRIEGPVASINTSGGKC